MTLIACTDSADFVAISDITLSNEKAPKRAMALPMRGHREVHLQSYVSGSSRKMLLRNNTLIMWAGRFDVARELFRRILDESADGQDRLDLADLISRSGLNEAEKASTSIIACHVDRGRMNKQWHNCSFDDQAGTRMIYSGTGFWDFFNNTRSDKLDLEGIQSRAVVNLMLEMTSESTFIYNYGGWFEVVGVSDDLQLRQIPYAVKFWTVENDMVKFGNPLVFSWYAENALCVANVEGLSSDEEVTSVHVIEDVLRLTSIDEAPALRWEPSVTYHVVRNRTLQKVRVKMEGGPNQSISLVTDGRGQRFEFKRALLDEFLSTEFWDRDVDLVQKELH